MQCWENYLTLAWNWLLVLFRSPTLRCLGWCVPLPSLLCFALPIEIANYLILDFASSTVPWWASKSAFFFTCALPFIHTNRFMKTTMSAHTEWKERKQQRKELFVTTLPMPLDHIIAVHWLLIYLLWFRLCAHRVALRARCYTYNFYEC